MRARIKAITLTPMTASTITPQARNDRPVTRPDGDAAPGPAALWAVGLGAGVTAGVLVEATVAAGAGGATVAGPPLIGLVAVGGTGVLTMVVLVIGAEIGVAVAWTYAPA